MGMEESFAAYIPSAPGGRVVNLSPSPDTLTCYVENHRRGHHAGADEPVGYGQVHHETVGNGAKAAGGHNGQNDQRVADDCD